MTRRYRVTHRTTYRYSDDVTASYGRAHLVPRDSDGQHRLSHRLRIDPAPADRSTGTDAWGNITDYFHVTAPHRTLEIVGESVVEVATPPPDRWRSGDAAAPWEAARPTGRAAALAVEFTLDLDPPQAGPEVVAYAAESLLPGRPLGEAVADLCRRIHRDFAYRPGATTVSSPVAAVMAARAGVCQDFARLACACLRAHGLAAGYVSGYLATDPPPGRTRVVGADATHAWASVWTPHDGWFGFDPTNDTVADERYVVVGRARDYADIPPLRGVIWSEARHSVIDVGVDVAPLRL